MAFPHQHDTRIALLAVFALAALCRLRPGFTYVPRDVPVLRNTNGFTTGSPTSRARLLRPRLALQASSDTSDKDADGQPSELEAPVSWLQPVDVLPEVTRPELDASRQDVTILPCFPMSNVPFLPHAEHEVAIFEPRYRQMYNDILLSGSRRFVVPAIDDEGRLQQVGVIFYLKDLREMSEQTDNAVKWNGHHEVIGRVRIDRVLNPKAFIEADTYLRVETTPLEDIDVGLGALEEEQLVMDQLREIQSLLGSLSEPVGMEYAVTSEFNATRQGEWQLIEVWSNVMTARLQLAQYNFENKVDIFASEAVGADWRQKTDSFPKEVLFQLLKLYDAFQETQEPAVAEHSLFLQRAIQCNSHQGRLALLSSTFAGELARLRAKKAIKDIFD